MKVVRLVMAGFTEATMETTLSRDTPIAFAYRGRVMNALQKQAKAVLTTILAASPVTAALRLLPILLYTTHNGRTNRATPIRLDSSPTYMEFVPTVISLIRILMISTQAAEAGPNMNRAMMDGTSLKSTL